MTSSASSRFIGDSPGGALMTCSLISPLSQEDDREYSAPKKSACRARGVTSANPERAKGLKRTDPTRTVGIRRVLKQGMSK